MKSSTKILLITNLCSPYRVGLFELLHKMYDIRFLFFSAGEERYYDGESTIGDFRGEYLWGFQVGSRIKINPRLIKELAFSHYTHVIKCINGPVPLLAAFVIAKFRGKKFILWTSLWHHPETTFHRVFFPVVRWIYEKCDAVVVYGAHVKKYLVSLGLPGDKISIAWQVQDNAKFNMPVAKGEKEELREGLSIKTSKVVLYVGRLVADKGVPILVEAFRGLGLPDVSLLLVGNGPLASDVDNRTAERIFHVPRVQATELFRYYALSDILVLPSITTPVFKEPWGFVVNEAMCQGCAIITSDAVGAGVGGLVEEGGNGLVVPERSVPALAGALSKLLTDDVQLNRMKIRSKEIIREWTYPKMAEGFTEALAIADGRKGG
jgi:glycosyltransferase involved in cell wall biosynthesis